MSFWKLLLIIVVGLFSLPQAWAGEESKTLTASVQLQEKTLTVTVFYHQGSEPWARTTLATASEALPVLEERIGFPYPYYFPVMIHQSTLNETHGRDAQIRWRLNASTRQWSRYIHVVPGKADNLELIHELAHYWTIYDEIWLMEGFAQYYAFITLHSLGEESLTEAYYRDSLSMLMDNPSLDQPLIPWKWSSSLEERFLYRKSFFFVRLLAESFGPDTIKRINAQVYETEGIIPYDPRAFGVVDSPYFKAALENETGNDLSPLFSGWVTEGSYNYNGENVTLSWWLGDEDGDGVISLEEYAQNTDPREASLLQRLLDLLKGILGKLTGRP